MHETDCVTSERGRMSVSAWTEVLHGKPKTVAGGRQEVAVGGRGQPVEGGLRQELLDTLRQLR